MEEICSLRRFKKPLLFTVTSSQMTQIPELHVHVLLRSEALPVRSPKQHQGWIQQKLPESWVFHTKHRSWVNALH